MSLYAELNRRAVFRIAAAYIVIGWVLLQVAGMVLARMAAPELVQKSLTAVYVLLLVPTVALTWVLDSGPRPSRSAWLEIATIGAMMLAVVLMVRERFTGTAPPTVVAKPAASAPVVASAPAAPEIEIPPNSIAVLPFTNRSTVEGSGYFVDGIHDDLLTQLARLSALKVISRTSVMEYRGSDKPLAQIGKELGVATILEAAVQRAGERVRITAQLADAASGKQLWGSSYDRELTASNVFEIQSEIAKAIAGELISTLSPAQIRKIEVVPHTTDQLAYDLYLQARATGAESIDRDIQQRLGLYKQAADIDPKFALAIGEAGIEYTNHYWFVTRDPADRDEGRRWIDRALELAPDEPRLQWLLARHLYHGHLDYDGALRVLDTAEKGLPNGAEIFELRSWILRRQGKFKEAIEANERAIRLDPRNPYAITEHLDTVAALGDLEAVHRWQSRLDALPPLDDTLRVLEVKLPEFLLTGDGSTIDGLLAKLPAGGLEAALQEVQVVTPYLERRFDEALVAVDALATDTVTSQNRILTRSLMHALVRRAQGNAGASERDAAAALADIDAFLKKLPDDPRAVAARGLALALLGRSDEARAEASRSVDLYPLEKDRFGGPWYLATRLRTLAVIGEEAEFAHALEEYLSLPAMGEHIDYLLLDPVFDGIKAAPAVAALISQHTLRKA